MVCKTASETDDEEALENLGGHDVQQLLSYCSFVRTGGLFLIIFREAKHSRVYLTYQTLLTCCVFGAFFF